MPYNNALLWDTCFAWEQLKRQSYSTNIEALKQMDKEDLRLLYSVSVSDIQNFKEQQWKVTNYVLLLDAAFISISKLVEKLYCLETVLLCIATIVVVVVGCYFTRRLHKSISLRQGRLELIQNEFGEEFINYWKGGNSEAEICESKKDVLWLFWSVQITAAVIVFWLIVRPFVNT